MQHLQPNTTLQGGKYVIERVLGQGGFGNTYVGYNTEFEETVAIKEFFMKGVTERDETTCVVSVSNADNVQQFEEQREKFKKEARRIRQLKNDHIVKVHDLFEENGTAYYVMDFVNGENLAEKLKRTGKPMTEEEVSLILPQILDALKAVHQERFCHLDIKPSNIMLGKDGVVKLIDFGASKQLRANGTLTTNAQTAFAQTPGYAPREQMEQNLDKIGPWTDIYALGATLYNLLTNKRPPLPSDIDDDMSEDKHLALPFPESVGSLRFLVLQMMKPNRLQRPQSVDAITIAENTTHKSSKATAVQQETYSTTNIDNEETIIAKATPQVDNSKTEQRSNKSSENEHKKGSSRTKINPFAIFWCIIIIIIGFLMVVAIFSPIDNDSDNTPVNGYYSETFEDGSKYVGNYKNGVFEGHGTYTYANGDQYTGNFKNGAPDGYGRLTYVSGDQYTGNFKNGAPDGYGKLTYVNGDQYNGKYKNGVFDGTGVYTMADGTKYMGEWKNGVPDGHGTYTYVNGEEISGIWKEGEFVETEAE